MRGTLYSCVVVLIGAVGCSSSAASPDGGGTANGGDASSGSPSRSKTGDCPSSTSTCTQSELDTYVSCTTTQCDAQYKDCFGANYQSGTWAGKCQTFMTCTTACKCGDTACTQACGTPTGDCAACYGTLGACTTSKCPIPKCMMGGAADAGTTSGKTCADLKTCCDSIADATKKAACTAGYDAAKSSGDAVCGALYQVEVTKGNCK